MKKNLILVMSLLVIFACNQEVKKVEKVSVVPKDELTKVCDSLIFEEGRKIKVKLEKITVNGKPIKLDGECVVSLCKEN